MPASTAITVGSIGSRPQTPHTRAAAELPTVAKVAPLPGKCFSLFGEDPKVEVAGIELDPALWTRRGQHHSRSDSLEPTASFAERLDPVVDTVNTQLASFRAEVLTPT